MMKIAKYGWIPDLPNRPGEEGGDRIFRPMALRLDAEGGLNPELIPPKFNQLTIGSCTGSSSGRGWGMYLTAKEGQPRTPLSALFPYFNGRLQEGTTASDSGCQIRDVIKGIIKYGLCAESLCPYDITKFAVKPSDRAYRDAHFTVLDSYERIVETGPKRVLHAKTALAQGWPVAFGFTVYESFESRSVAHSGVVPMPLGSE